MAKKKDRNYWWMILPVCLFLHTSAQTLPRDSAAPANCIVGKIGIQGNRKTKDYIITRELSFKTGDTITIGQLVTAFRTAHDRLINTHLFNEVVLYVKNFSGYIVDVQ